ncbi:hypothetical protein P3T23_009472 [Paraburkholderia sp. GAS448]|uniref:hypothetical protein n=1 Tax=Paraburkholderia sp. GAS448 TaxID=3035136 RepID=UPI003D20D9E4
MPSHTRQYFATSQQFSDAVIRQITQTEADNQLITGALQAGTEAVQTAYPGAQIVYGTFSYLSATGKWMRQIDLLIGLASALNHFRYAILLNMKNNLGDYYVDTSNMQTFTFLGGSSAIGAR